MQNLKGALMGQALLAKYGEDFEEIVDLIIGRAKTGHFDAGIHYPYSDYWQDFCFRTWSHCVENLGLSFRMTYGCYGSKKAPYDYITVRVWWSG